MTAKKILIAVSSALILCVLIIIYLLKSVNLSDSSLTSAVQLGSYAVGYRIVQEQKSQAVKLDQQALLMGVSEALAGKKRFSHEQLVNFEVGLREYMAAGAVELAEVNKKISEEFLAQNKSREGVVVLPSGTQYKILENGEGARPTKNDWVKIAYEVKLLSGELYESSKVHGEWVDIPVTNAFPAMQEALQGMRVGAHWTVYAPPHRAYGSVPRQGLEPNTLLVIDLKLREVLKK